MNMLNRLHGITSVFVLLYIPLLAIGCFSLKEPKQYSGEDIKDFYKLPLAGQASLSAMNSMDKLEVTTEDKSNILKIDGKTLCLHITEGQAAIEFDSDSTKSEPLVNKDLYDHKDNQGKTRLFVLQSTSPKPTDIENKDKKIIRPGTPPPTIIIVKQEEDKLMFQTISRKHLSVFFHDNRGYKKLLEDLFGFTKLNIGNLQTNADLKEIDITSLNPPPSTKKKKVYDLKNFIKDISSLTSKGAWKVFGNSKKSELVVSDWRAIPTQKGLLILCKSMSGQKSFFLIPPAKELVITHMGKVYNT